MRLRRFVPIVLILLAATAVYLVGLNATPLIDRDEPRYAQTSKQMLENGNWVVPYFLDDLRLKKPIFIYWCQAASMAAFGPSVFAARLPSVVAFVGTLALLAVALPRVIGTRRATWTAFILATSVLSLWAAKTCLTDAVLLAWITTAMACLYAILRGRTTWPVMAVLGLSIGLAALTKGPVVLMYLGLTALGYGLIGKTFGWGAAKPAPTAFPMIVPTTPRSEEEEAEYRAEMEEAEQRATANREGEAPAELGPPKVTDIGSAGASPSHAVASIDPQGPLPNPLPGYRARGPEASTLRRTFIGVGIVIACALAVLLPWVVALQLKMPGAIGQMLSKEIVERGTSAQENHSGPPGFYLATLALAWFPWVILLPGAIAHAWFRRRRPEVRFALAAVIGPWIFLEIYRTKLPHYFLPSYPFLALLTADFLLAAARHRNLGLTRRGFLIATKVLAVLLGIAGVAAFVLPWMVFPDLPSAFKVSAVLLIVAYLATGLLAAREFNALRPLRGAAALGVGTWLICAVSWGLYFPSAPFLKLSPRIADVLRREGATGPGDVRMVDYKEGSLAFYQGGTIREQSDEDFMQTDPPSAWPKWLVTTREHLAAQDPWKRDRWEIVNDDLRGFNVAEGKIYNVVVLRKR